MNRLRRPLILLFACLATLSNAQQNLRLWYSAPAADWNAALPIGNGTLAAMIFGGPAVDRLQLNEGTVWAGMPYQSMGDLYLSFPNQNGYKAYTRDLNISTAVASVKYTLKGVTYTREYYSSLSDSILVVHLKASKPKSITCNLSLSMPHQKCRIYNTDGMLVLSGTTETHERQTGKVRFMTQVKPLLKNGRCTVKDDVLSIDKADEVTIYISMATNFVNYKDISGDEVDKCSRLLNRAYGKESDNLKLRHTTEYQKLFNRVTLDLGTTPQALKPTDQRIRDFAKASDPDLAALYFQFGRYLLISCSQPGGQPATLQGLWNEQIMPAWDSKYTVNINTEMNYWAQSGMWPMAGAWLSRHLWEHYQYTGDKAFLQTNFPIMLDAARFYVDFLVKEPSHGWLVVSPGSSPENNPKATGGTASNVAGCTMDNQIVFDLFSNVLAATEILNGGIKGLFNTSSKAFADTLRNTLAQMPPMQVGQFSLLDGNHAYKLLQNQLKGGTYTNMFCAHPPFQIDGNFGCTAGIAEMLLQSQDGFIFVLPALPSVWKNGSVNGLKARGGFEFDITWNNNAVETLKIKSLLGGYCRIRSAVELVGKGLKPAKGDNSNPYYRVAETPKPLISDKAQLKPIVLPETQLYDLKMAVGETIVLTRKI